MIEDRFAKRFPNVIADYLTRKLASRVFELLSKLAVTLLASREADDCHCRWKIAIGGEVIKRGNQFAMSEIASSAKNHNGARLRHSASGNAFAKRVQVRLVGGSIHLIHRLRRRRGEQSRIHLHGSDKRLLKICGKS